MAKTVGFTKFKLKPNDEIKKVIYNNIEFEVKTYLPINDKLEMFANVINSAADENKFWNEGKLRLFFTLEIIKNYTNISFTEKQLEDPAKLYDTIVSSGLFEVIKSHLFDQIYSDYCLLFNIVESIYTYNNSVYGILDSLSKDYSNLNFDASELQKMISNKEDIGLLKDIMDKLG